MWTAVEAEAEARWRRSVVDPALSGGVAGEGGRDGWREEEEGAVLGWWRWAGRMSVCSGGVRGEGVRKWKPTWLWWLFGGRL